MVAAVTCLPVCQGVSLAHADPPAPMPQPVLQPLASGEVIRIGPAAGTGTPTRDYGIGATDLCVFLEFPTQVVQVCGDSFAGEGVGFGGYYSPIALRVDTSSVDDPDGVKYTGVTGVDRTAAGRAHTVRGVPVAGRRRADQPAELRVDHYHQRPGSAEFTASES